MKILGIESSCDETAIAIVTKEADRVHIEQSVVLSQVQDHAQYGGVVPEVAARKHLEAIFPMLENEIPRDGASIDAIAVTAGPGLAPALRTGVEVAKTLAFLWQKPLIPVSHLEGHIYSVWCAEEGEAVPAFPALCLLVSGGHTEFVVMRDHGAFERIGETIDDAAGEAFDKVAHMLGLGYPGGPAISREAINGSTNAFTFPRGLLDRSDLDMSFSGLKTSVLYTLRKNEAQLSDPQFISDIAASFEEAVVDVLCQKTERAIKRVKPQSLIVAGGVSANGALRSRLRDLADIYGVAFFVPPLSLTGDNAAMIAAAGGFRILDPHAVVIPSALVADPNLDFSPSL